MAHPSEHDDDFEADFDAILRDPFVVSEKSPLSLFDGLHDTFMGLVEGGFTETQALKFLAFCSIYEGDH